MKSVFNYTVRTDATQADGTLKENDQLINDMLGLLQGPDKLTVVDIKLSCAVHGNKLLSTYLVICEE